jgi:GntR family transcriptional regulator
MAEASLPLYQQLAVSLRDRIRAGDFGPGDALPSERGLSELTGMSRVTVRKSLDELVREGLLSRRRGAGTFVARQIETPGTVLSGFSDDARLRGETPEVIWFLKTYAPPTEEEAAALELPTQAPVARLGRVRLSSGEPLAIEHAVVPSEFLPYLDQLEDSLYAVFDKLGTRPVAGVQRIRASLATPTEAAILSIKQGAEILRIERLCRTAAGRVIEFTRSAYRGDRYVFASDLDGNDGAR